MMKLIQIIKPPDKWMIAVIVLLGMFIGGGGYIFYVSRAYSYLSDQPETCVNCHIMAPQYATWQHSSHKTVTNCNDCHVPHDNVIHKYVFKAQDGMRHATIFTMRAEPQVIFIKEAGRKVVQENCKRCHEQLVDGVKSLSCPKSVLQHSEERLCWECHRETPHGRVNSLSSVPYARVPMLESPVPNWLQKLLKKK